MAAAGGADLTLPTFFVLGAPKAGTTALHEALAASPHLFLSPVKEPKHFLCGDRPPDPRRQRGPGDAHSAREWVWQRSRYEALFAAAPPGVPRGESTPFSLADPDAQRRIAAAVPGRPPRRPAARPGRPGALELDAPVV